MGNYQRPNLDASLSRTPYSLHFPFFKNTSFIASICGKRWRDKNMSLPRSPCSGKDSPFLSVLQGISFPSEWRWRWTLYPNTQGITVVPTHNTPPSILNAVFSLGWLSMSATQLDHWWKSPWCNPQPVGKLFAKIGQAPSQHLWITRQGWKPFNVQLLQRTPGDRCEISVSQLWTSLELGLNQPGPLLKDIYPPDLSWLLRCLQSEVLSH